MSMPMSIPSPSSLGMPNEDYTRKINKRDVIKRVSNIIVGMQGDVYGDTLYNVFIPFHMKLDIKKLTARISAAMVSTLLHTLRTFYNVQTIAQGRTWMIMPIHFVGSSLQDGKSAAQVSFEPFELELCMQSRGHWKIAPVCFDIEHLAMDAAQVYIRPCLRQEVLQPQSNRIEYLMERIQTKRFSLCDPRCYPTVPQTIYAHTVRCFERAYKMVQDGWIMDDSTLGNRTFVIGAWSMFTNWYPIIRGHADHSRESIVTNNAECPLCHEPYLNTDIVINLPCNHTFHCMCQARRKEGGLFAWVIHQGKETCPVCRECLMVRG